MMRRIIFAIFLCFQSLFACLWADIQVQGYLNNAALENLAADPTCAPAVTCPEGRFYWDSVLNKFRVWDGTIWADVLVGAGSVPDPLLLADGAPGGPTYSFLNESTSGWLRGGAGQIELSILGTSRHYFAASFYQLQGATTASVYITPGVGATAHLSMGSVGDLVDGRISYDNTTKTMTMRTNDSTALSLGSSNVGKSTFTSRLVVDNGELAQPAYASNIDFDTGMYFPAAGNISFSAIGTNRFTIDSNAITSIEPMRLHNGSTTAPSYSFTSDVDLGIYRRGADNAGLSGNFILDSNASGYAGTSQANKKISLIASGMNTTSSITPHIAFGSDDPELSCPVGGCALVTLHGRADETYNDATDGRMSLVINGKSVNSAANNTYNDMLTISSDGELYVGAPGVAASPAYSFAGNTTDGMFSRTNTSLGFAVEGVEKFIVGGTLNRSNTPFQTANGTSAAPGYGFTTNVDTGMYFSGSTLYQVVDGVSKFAANAGNVFLRFDATTYSVDVCGSLSSGLTSIDNCSSSIRYKEEVVDLPEDESSKLWDLRPVRYKWKKNEEVNYGFIAEEVHAVLPNLTYLKMHGTDSGDVTIMKDENGDPLVEGVHYKHLTALLLSEMKKLKTRIEVLEAQ